MYKWFSQTSHRVILLLFLFSPVILFLLSIALLEFNLVPEWAYWNMQRGFLATIYLFPLYFLISAGFALAALIRQLRKREAKYYWWFGFLTATIPLLLLVWLASLAG